MTQTAGGNPGAIKDALFARTSDQILGPFYPLVEPSKGGDMTRIAGRPGQAQGQLIHLSGRVLDRFGTPVRHGKVQIWQANQHGRYDHPNDDNPAPLDPCFQGFAVVETDGDGRYAFKTIKPGAYATGPNTMRPSHIHFEVFGKRERLITQMYFAGDPYQKEDRWLQSARRPESLIMALEAPVAGMDASAKRVTFDIVLMHG